MRECFDGTKSFVGLAWIHFSRSTLSIGNEWKVICTSEGVGLWPAYPLLHPTTLIRYVTNQPPKANSAFHPSRVGKWVPASAGKAQAGMVHSVSRCAWGVQVKLWDPLRTRAIPERLRGVFTTRRYTIHVYLYLYYSYGMGCYRPYTQALAVAAAAGCSAGWPYPVICDLIAHFSYVSRWC